MHVYTDTHTYIYRNTCTNTYMQTLVHIRHTHRHIYTDTDTCVHRTHTFTDTEYSDTRTSMSRLTIT